MVPRCLELLELAVNRPISHRRGGRMCGRRTARDCGRAIQVGMPSLLVLPWSVCQQRGGGVALQKGSGDDYLIAGTCRFAI